MKKKIDSFSISNLLVASHYEFHRSTYALILETTAAVLKIEDLFPQYDTEIGVLFQLVNRAQGSVFSEKIKEMDLKRDGLIGELFTIVDFAAGSQIPTRKEPGLMIKRVIAPYRGIASNEYTKETGQIRGMLRDLGAADELVDAQDALGLGAVVQELRKTNNKLAEYMGERSTEMGTRAATNNTNTDEQRRIVDDLYRQIIEKVNAVAIVLPDPAIDTFIDAQNGIVLQYKHVLANQKAGGTGTEKGTGKDKEEEPEVPVE
ncbi:DUF6261 family protein [Bacteroides sp. OttesenSCG-928-J23]|nr:DUF6261 family protein [Bacteroides sp. OttesenSCG-928-J23]